MSTQLTLILSMLLVCFGSLLVWCVIRPVPKKRDKMISMAERHLYEGPPEPCCVYSTVVDGKSCLAARSLITGKDRIFPSYFRSWDVAEVFNAYGYTLARESLSSKIKLLDW